MELLNWEFFFLRYARNDKTVLPINGGEKKRALRRNLRVPQIARTHHHDRLSSIICRFAVIYRHRVDYSEYGGDRDEKNIIYVVLSRFVL